MKFSFSEGGMSSTDVRQVSPRRVRPRHACREPRHTRGTGRYVERPEPVYTERVSPPSMRMFCPVT